MNNLVQGNRLLIETYWLHKKGIMGLVSMEGFISPGAIPTRFKFSSFNYFKLLLESFDCIQFRLSFFILIPLMILV